MEWGEYLKIMYLIRSSFSEYIKKSYSNDNK